MLNIPRVMIVCDKDNLPSPKTAVGCGGILTCENTFEGIEQQVYWIDIC